MMKFIRNISEKIRPKFAEDGPWHVMHPLYDALDTFMFNTNKQTTNGPHIRDSVDLKRVMIIVVAALLPATIFGIFNAGYQEALAFGLQRTWLAHFLAGLKIFIPIVLVSYIVGGFWEVLFASIRKHEVDEGYLVTGLLIPLIMPVTIPLWQVAVATTFGVVIGKMIFGGTGMNIFNPALTARAFVFFSYPGNISGDKVWIGGPDGFSGATALSIPASQVGKNAVSLLDSVPQFDFSWINMFMGWIPGSIGETSALMILIGAFILILTKVGSWRIMVGGVLGMVITALITNFTAPYSSNSMLTIPAHYHLVMGGFLFGIVFMATDPVSACYTNAGRWIYGILIGFLTVIIRSINPAYPEGTMLAILLMNAFSPLIDYFVVQKNIKRRMARYAQ